MDKAIHTSKLAHDNDLLTQTGPGTPGGDLLRRYWQPIMLLQDFPSGAAPVPLRVDAVEKGDFCD
jgi:phthalate 4,5-dioxygenase oxygenase subunit